MLEFNLSVSPADTMAMLSLYTKTFSLGSTYFCHLPLPQPIGVNLGQLHCSVNSIVPYAITILHCSGSGKIWMR